MSKLRFQINSLQPMSPKSEIRQIYIEYQDKVARGRALGLIDEALVEEKRQYPFIVLF